MISQALSQFADHCKSEALFGLPSWNKYLDYGHDANGQCTLGDGFVAGDIWLVAAAVLEILIRVAGVVAVFYIIAGGFKYITSQGAPDQTAQARKTIISAIAGLAIAIVATSAVSFIAGTLAGGTVPEFCELNSAGVCQVTEVSTNETIVNALNVVYAVAGAVAAILVVIGGFKYTTSTGDPQKINSSRNTIIYSLVGLVVVVLAAAITSLVISKL
jgi:hypothetical protein